MPFRFCSLYLACHTFRYLWYSSSTAYAANDSNKENTENTVHVYWHEANKLSSRLLPNRSPAAWAGLFESRLTLTRD